MANFGDYAQALGAAQQLVPNWRQGDIVEAQLAQARLQYNGLEQQQSAFDKQQEYVDQRRSSFQTALSGLGAKPTPEKLYRLSVDFPEFAQTINQAAKGVGEEHRATVVRQLAPIQALIQNGQHDKALAEVTRHIDADKAAGLPADEHDVELRDLLASGDPEKIKAAGGMLYGLIAAVNPDTAAKNIGERQQNGNHVITQGGALVDDSGKVLYQSAPPETNALEVPIYDDQGHRVGTQLIANGGKGGDPVSSGGGAPGESGGPRRSMGWTPRARDGGDNSDAAVDSKLKLLSKATGFDIDAPLTPSQAVTVIAAIPATEGGASDLPAKLNNPSAIKDGPWARKQPGYAGSQKGYAKFKTTELGQSAAQKLGSNFYNRGQRTIRDIIEGKPVGGSGSGSAMPQQSNVFGPVAAAPGSKDAPSGYQWNGNRLEPIPGGPADKGKTGGGKALPDAITKRLEPKIEARDGLQTALGTFRNDFGGHNVLGDASNTLQSVTGLGSPGQRDWWAQFRSIDNQVRNSLFGASLTDGEKAAYNATTITPRMAPTEIKRNLNSRLAVINKALARQKNVLGKSGYSQDSLDALFGAAPSAPANGGFRIIARRPK